MLIAFNVWTTRSEKLPPARDTSKLKLLHWDGKRAIVTRRIRYTCSSAWELFQCLYKMKRRRFLTQILVPRRWRNHFHGLMVAAIPMPILGKYHRTQTDFFPFDDARLDDDEYLELIAVEAWQRAEAEALKGRIETLEGKQPNPFA